MYVFAWLFAVLVLASVLGWLFPNANVNARIRAWWVMIALGGVAYGLRPAGIVALFVILAALALAEFRAVRAPVLPALLTIAGVLHVPWLLPRHGGAELALFLVVVAQASDVLQFLWGRALGRTPIAPRVSPGKTVEGTVGGIISAAMVGAVLTPLTGFPVQKAAALALAIASAGFAGGLYLSSIKRRLGIKDWGEWIAGHGGILDRLDSLWLSAPVFYYLTL